MCHKYKNKNATHAFRMHPSVCVCVCSVCVLHTWGVQVCAGMFSIGHELHWPESIIIIGGCQNKSSSAISTTHCWTTASRTTDTDLPCTHMSKCVHYKCTNAVNKSWAITSKWWEQAANRSAAVVSANKEITSNCDLNSKCRGRV